jgi:hypothetical protein
MSDKKLEQMCREHRLTASGCEWLKAAIDPFHDYDLVVDGFPDLVSDKSIVLKVQKSVSISKPASFDAGNWDANIALTPLDYTRNSAGHGCTYSWISGAGGQVTVDPTLVTTPNQGFLGLCAVSMAPSSDPTFVCEASGTGLESSAVIDLYDQLHPPSTGEDTVGRVIACGFEVVNTTAEINKQGSVTCYVAPNFNSLDQRLIVNSTSPGIIASTPTVRGFMAPPQDLSKAKLLNNSVTFGADEGCYVVGRMGVDPRVEGNHFGPVLMKGNGVGASTYVGELAPVIPGTSTVSSTTDYPISHFNTFETSGAYFTGLSDQTTLTVTLRAYVEIFPMDNELLVSLATPSAGFDPVAIELASRIMRTMPPGVPVAENAMGDYFRRAMRTLGSVMTNPAVRSVVEGAVPGAKPVYLMGDVVRQTLNAKKKSQSKTPKNKRRDPQANTYKRA